MDELPTSLILEILTRLSSSIDLARCRLVCKTLNSIAPHVRTIRLYGSYTRYARSRSITPFKEAFEKLISELHVVDTISIGVDKPLNLDMYDDAEDERDDLFLNDVDFVKQWLPKVCGELRSLSISDFWVQSCWRRSNVLSLVSSLGIKILELDIKNAWLSVDGLTPMMRLTTLTLEFIRLDDENLEKLNECFPCLRVLNLIGVGGLKEPKIHLMHLESCRWSLSSAPNSVSVVAPSLVKLTLKCVKPDYLLIETPLISILNLSLGNACTFRVKEFSRLKDLHLESTDLCNLLVTLPFGRTVTNLTAGSSKWKVPFGVTKSILELLLRAFPCVSTLTFTAGLWSEIESYFGHGCLEASAGMQTLKEIRAYITVDDVELTLSTIFFLLDNCSQLRNMVLFVHRDVVSKVTSNLISVCISHRAKVRWKWGMWKDGTEDTWISEGTYCVASSSIGINGTSDQ